MLLTCHQPVMVDIANYWKGEPIVQKPYAVNLIQYNLYIGGVDQLDQQFYSVRILRKTRKWYRKLTLRLISQAVLNANKVFVKTHGLKDVTFLKFMHNTIVLTLQLPPNLNQKNIQPDDALQRLTGRNFPGIKKTDKVGSKDPRPIAEYVIHVTFILTKGNL